MTTHDYRLDFQLRLPYSASHKLLMGQLALWQGPKLIKHYPATSGCISYQFKGSQRFKGRGPLPASAQLGEDQYRVITTPLDGKNIRGIRGLFFAITPSTVKIGGTVRGDFCLHNDSDGPGSAGCVVTELDLDWAELSALLVNLNKIGILKIPLKVSYL